MNESIKARVKALELLCYDDPLYICVKNDETEEEKIVTVDEFLKMPGYYMIKVVGGSSLKDLDKLLYNIRDIAFKEAEEERG